jgi:chromosome partitioning protein
VKTIVVMSQKGGAGKTTLAINLAAAAIKSGFHTVLADTDPQQSAYNWYKDRQDGLEPDVISSFPDRLGENQDLARQAGVDYFIVDTPPNASEYAIRVAKLADLIIIPTKPSCFDLVALERTVTVLETVNKPAFAVLNECPTYGSEADDAEEALLQYGLTTLPNRIHNRASIRRHTTPLQTIFEYEPDGKAAVEFSALFKAIALHFLREHQAQRKLQPRKEAVLQHVQSQ